MIDNKIRYEVDGSGGYIALPVGSVRALTDYTSIIELVSPLPLDTSVMVNFLVYDARNVDLPLFMAPNGKKGWQVSNNPLVADWNVWEVGIDQTALTAIAKYRSGRIGVSFTFRERRPSKNAITYKGVFDEFNALPTTGVNDGDYYVCKSYNIILAGVKYTYNDNAVWQSTKWVRDRNMRTLATTSTTDLPVDPALLANIPEVPEQDIADLIAQWGGGFIDMQTHINNEEIHVSPLDREKWYAMLPKDGTEPMEGNLNMDGNEITGVDKVQFNRGSSVGSLGDNDFTIILKNGETFTFSENGLNMYLNKLTGVAKGANSKDGANMENIADIESDVDDLETEIGNIKDGTTIVKKAEQDQLGNVINTTYETKAVVSGISALISSLDLSKLNKEFTSLIEEVSLSLSDVFVVDKGSGARKVSLGTIASYLSTQELELFTIIEELPNENQNPNTIYLLTTENEEGQNQLLEYIWIANQERWELIGSLEVDLSDYYTKTEVNGLLEDKVDKVAGKGLSTNDYTNVDKNKVDLIETEGDGTKYFGDDGQYHDKSTIDELLGNLTTLGFVKRSGTNTYIIDTSTYQPLDDDLTSIAGLSGTSGFLKKTSSNTWSLDTSVYITGITKAMVETVLTGTITTHTHNASDIVEDATHRFVTDTEKSTWNGKQNALTAGDGISISDNVISADSELTVETWITDMKTLALSDATKLFICYHAGNQTVTIPSNTSVSFPIGTMITFLLTSLYKVTFVGADGVTLTSMDSLVELATIHSMASLIKIAPNTWQLVGALE